LNAYIIIVLFSALVLACLSVFLVFLVRPDHRRDQRSESLHAVAGLSAEPAAIFVNSEYFALRARPELKSVCAQYRRDRRRIALLWLGELERDVRLVWEFRRFLVRNGLAVTFREEAAIALGGSLAMCYLKTVRLAVFFGGPFILPRALRAARLPVVRLSNRGAGLLAKAPADTKAQLERKWTQHVLSWSPA
jgi:hypothetical protein